MKKGKYGTKDKKPETKKIILLAHSTLLKKTWSKLNFIRKQKTIKDEAVIKGKL